MCWFKLTEIKGSAVTTVNEREDSEENQIEVPGTEVTALQLK